MVLSTSSSRASTPRLSRNSGVSCVTLALIAVGRNSPIGTLLLKNAPAPSAPARKPAAQRAAAAPGGAGGGVPPVCGPGQPGLSGNKKAGSKARFPSERFGAALTYTCVCELLLTFSCALRLAFRNVLFCEFPAEYQLSHNFF